MGLRSLFEHIQDAAQIPVAMPAERCRGCGCDIDIDPEIHMCNSCAGRRSDEIGRIMRDLAANGPATAIQLSESAGVPVSVATAYLRGGAEAAMRARAPLPMDEATPMNIRDHMHRRVEQELEDTPAGHR